jgi:hypothetical protein
MPATPIQMHFAPGHAELFGRAAREFNVSILVRRTNQQSIQYIGKPGYVPKPLTCKAKTAKKNIYLGGRLIRCAGLVVDPRINGFNQAFESSSQHRSAIDVWNKEFRMRLAPDQWQVGLDEARQKYVHISGRPSADSAIAFKSVNTPGQPIREATKFHVTDDYSSDHFGCVMYGSNPFVASYMHGDYDLYGIVSLDNPSLNEITRGQMFGKAYNLNNFGPEFGAVARFLNTGFSGLHGRRVDMIRHGSQEKYAAAHGDEELDVFWPDGSTSYVAGESAIWNLYKDKFRNRRIGHAG